MSTKHEDVSAQLEVARIAVEFSKAHKRLEELSRQLEIQNVATIDLHLELEEAINFMTANG